MSCQCEIYEICAQCAPSQEHFLKAVRDHDEVVSRLPSSSPSYTLAELTTLAKQFVAEYPSRGDSEWLMSLWLVWLEKREKEGIDEVEP